MELSILQIVFITLIAYLKMTDTVTTQLFAFNTIICGWLTGLVVGDPTTGLSIGATMQLMSMGVVEIPISHLHAALRKSFFVKTFSLLIFQSSCDSTCSCSSRLHLILVNFICPCKSDCRNTKHRNLQISCQHKADQQEGPVFSKRHIH